MATSKRLGLTLSTQASPSPTTSQYSLKDPSPTGTECGQSTRTLSNTATDFDADLCALTIAAALAKNFLTLHPSHHVTIYSTNPAAIQAITNLRPHTGQFFALEFRSSLTEIFASSRTTRVSLEWCPSKVSIVGFRRCIDLARANTTAPLPPDHQEPHTIAHQKSSSKELALSAWQARWHNADRRSQAFLALPSPPLGKLPPVIVGAAGGSRTASATLIRLITGHAFVGSYTACFHPRKATHCPEFERARVTHLALIAPTLSLHFLFGTEEGALAPII
ncbi:hypothetical protein BJV77DRAFT_1071981 [Russula vinacea]|nr:hypothetical protein BJV77DRAFT_1071981 [Russula vinacea]